MINAVAKKNSGSALMSLKIEYLANYMTNHAVLTLYFIIKYLVQQYFSPSGGFVMKITSDLAVLFVARVFGALTAYRLMRNTVCM